LELRQAGGGRGEEEENSDLLVDISRENSDTDDAIFRRCDGKFVIIGVGLIFPMLTTYKTILNVGNCFNLYH
jgi:hypothetical protein